jgi:hypothetical protein
LKDDFYEFMMSGRKVVDGLGVLGAEYLIPFKMYAWINLMDKKRSGEHVNEKDIQIIFLPEYGGSCLLYRTAMRESANIGIILG